MAEVQKSGGTAALIDAEHAFDPEYSKVRLTWLPQRPLGEESVTQDSRLNTKPEDSENAAHLQPAAQPKWLVHFVASRSQG